MATIYIRFEAPQGVTPRRKPNFFQRVVKALLVRVVPSANPDFEGKIGAVTTWLVACDLDTGIPEREIGLDRGKKVIVKLPDHRNTGYWTDNNLILADFSRLFAVSPIDEGTFNTYWRSATT